MAQIVVKLESFVLPTIASLISCRNFASKSKSKVLITKGVKTTPSDGTKWKLKKTWKKPHGIMKVHLENKMLFGDLLETKIEKVKRIKSEIKENLNQKSSPEVEYLTNPIELDDSAHNMGKHFFRTSSELVKNSEINWVVNKKLASRVLNLEIEDDSFMPEPSMRSNLEKSEVQATTLHSTSKPANVELKSTLIEKLPSPVSHPFPYSKSENRLPSVTRILSATMSPEQKAILEKWERKMIKEMGLDRFREYKEELFSTGKDLHCNIRQLLSGTPEDELFIRDAIEGHWGSLRQVLSEIKQTHILESHVSHPHLQYCGIVDCVAQFRDKLVLIDWKTSEKPKPVVTMTYDTPLQIAAYIGAINEDPNYSLKIKEGLIVIAYKDGRQCETFLLTESDVAMYWKQWTRRLNLYHGQVEEAKALENKTDLNDHE